MAYIGGSVVLAANVQSTNQAVGTLEVQGSPVPAIAGADLSALVRRDVLRVVGRTLLGSSGLTLPLAAGSQVFTPTSFQNI